MFITKHAELRLFDRSSLHKNDLAKIITAHAYVVLGHTDTTAFGLLYSPQDAHCLIAVLSLDCTTLISIWKEDFVLPEGVQPVTRDLCKLARSRYHDYIFSSHISTRTEVVPTAVLSVQRNDEIATIDLGPCPQALDYTNRREVLGFVRPILTTVALRLSSSARTSNIRYQVSFHTPDTATVAAHSWRHNKKLRKLLFRTQ